MTNFDKENLRSLERLSRIKCTEEEEPALLDGIKKILDYAELLDEVDTEGVSPCVFVSQELQQNVMREDEIGDVTPTELFLSNAHDKIGGMIKVPTILNSD